jgi:alkylhydroperoxidase family enzyme
MKRVIQVEYEDASPEVRAVYDEIMDTMGSPSVLNTLKALGHNPRVLRGVWSMLKATLIEGEIPELLKQLILFRISIVAGNEYCTSLHGHAALNLDPTLTYDDLVALSGGSCTANLPPSLVDELLAVGFFSVMMNMLTDTYDVPWESPFPPPSD